MHDACTKCRAAEDFVPESGDQIRHASENLGKEDQEEQVNCASLDSYIHSYRYFGEVEEALVGHEVDLEAGVEVSVVAAGVRLIERLHTLEKAFECNVCFLNTELYHRKISTKATGTASSLMVHCIGGGVDNRAITRRVSRKN